jgi:hypothetical protein
MRFAFFRRSCTYIDLTHEETDKLVVSLPTGAGAIGGILTAAGVPVFAVGIVAAAIAAHLAWELAAIKAADRGEGVTLTMNAFLAIGMIVIPSNRIVERWDGWSAVDDFSLRSADGDEIVSKITHNGDPATVTFRLNNQAPSGWDKAFHLYDGTGADWIRYARPHAQTEDGLWAGQVHNGQPFTFMKPKMFGVWREVLSIRQLERLRPGSVVTFTWVRD